MVQDNNTQEDGGDGSDWSRRNVLKITGAGASIAALGGVSMVGTGQEDGETETPTGTETETPTGTETADDSAVVDDLIDPTFGYPLAADETGSVDIDTVVESDQLEGEDGVHEGFPLQPGPEGGEFPVEFIFDPVGLQVTPDQVVHFLSVVGEHTVSAFDEKYANPQLTIPTRVPEESPGFTSPPIVDGESWLYQFATPGVYDILCLPHYFFGMVMRVVVFDPEEDDIEDEAFSVEPLSEGPPNTQAVLNAPELDPANIVEAGEVAWADLTLEVPEPEPPEGTPGEGTPAEESPTGTPGDETPTGTPIGSPTETPGDETPTGGGTSTEEPGE